MLVLQTFSVNLKIDRSWGYLVNGTFGGIIGDFLKGTCDIGAVGFYFKEERLSVLEYTVPAYTVR